MIRIQWDQEEMVALVDLFFRTQHCSPSKRNSLIDELSDRLNKRADVLGIPHDEFFRNRNGITMMLMNLRNIATNGTEGLSATSSLMKETWGLFHDDHDRFLEILMSFHHKYGKKPSKASPDSSSSEVCTQSCSDDISIPLALNGAQDETHDEQPHQKTTEKSTISGRIIDEIGYSMANYVTAHNIPIQEKLYEFLNCDPTKWASTALEELSLSVRAYNRLRSKARTVADVLNMTLLDIAKIRQMGATSFEDILNTFRALVIEEPPAELNEIPEVTEPVALNSELLVYRDAIIEGRWGEIATEDLSPSSEEQLIKLKEAHELLGVELIQYCVNNPNNIFDLMTTISHQMTELSKEDDQLRALLAELPPERIHKNALGFIIAKHPDKPAIQRDLLACFGDEESVLKHVLTCRKRGLKRPMHLLVPFLEWCKFRIADEIDTLTALITRDERNLTILTMRAQGCTLNDAGNTFVLTRERVRQIEKRISNKFAQFQQSHHTLLKISAFRNGDTILTSEEIRPFLGEQAACLLYLFKTTPSKDYVYSQQYDAFTIGLAGVEKQVEEYVLALPEQFPCTQYSKYVNCAEEEHALPRELVILQINAVYNHNDAVYFRGRLSMGEMYAHILERFYPDGIHVHDDENIIQFRAKVLETYGADTKITDSTRAIAARIMDVGILCGRGIYKPKGGIHVPEHLLEEIREFIVSYQYPVILMNTLYAQFREQLQANGIGNKYYLQGILKNRFGDEFHFRRDYVSRDAESTSFYAALVDYIREFDYPIAKAQLFAAFPGVSEIIVNLAMMDESIVNYFGEYMHVERLKIQASERAALKNHVSAFLSDGDTHNSRALYKYIAPRMPHELKRWFIRNHFPLFSLCECLFKEDFQFARPYLALHGTELAHENQQALEFLSRSKVTKVSDLFDYLQSRQIRTMDALKFINSLNEEYFLIDQQALMSIDDIGVTEEHCQMIERMILDEITSCIPIRDLICTFRFPQLSVKWTDWLVYSVLNKWSQEIDVYASYNQFRYAIPLVAPKGIVPADSVMGKVDPASSSSLGMADLEDGIEEVIAEFLEEEDFDEFI